MSAFLSIDLDDPTPPYEQVKRALLRLIVGGELVPGARLPSVRQLAGDLGVAPGTVARSYRELEADGLLETARARGTTVSRAAPGGARDLVADPLQGPLAALVALARSEGVTRAELISRVEGAWDAGS